MSKSRKVLQISYYSNRVIQEFNSLAEASRKFGVTSSTISDACRGKLHSAAGYRWRYRDSIQ